MQSCMELLRWSQFKRYNLVRDECCKGRTISLFLTFLFLLPLALSLSLSFSFTFFIAGLLSLPAKTPTPTADPLNPRDGVLLSLRDLASSNAVLAVALVGVLILQSGQYYSERLERREMVEEDEARLRRRKRRLERSSQNQSAGQSTSSST